MVIYISIAVALAVAAIILYKKRKKKESSKNMAQGLQIFNANGKLVFDLNNRTTYVLGTGSTGTDDGSISDSGIVAGRTWVVVTSAPADAVIPIFTVSSGKISWDFYMSQSISVVHKRNITFMYGVY